MYNRLRILLKEHRDLVLYLVFGVLTTVVNYIVYLPLLMLLQFPASVCNVISWVVAVAFAFVTNKPFVFNSHDWSIHVVLPELGKFVGARLLSGVVETLVLLLTVDILGINGLVMKLVTSALVIILNYVTSKLFVFHKKKGA